MKNNAKRTPETRTIFNNYYDNDRFEDTAEYLFDEYADEEGWDTVEDVPEDEIWREMQFSDECAWDDAKYDLEHFLKENGPMLVVGSLGLWYGNFRGGKICYNFRDLAGAWEDCDYINIYDQNGHLYIECSHHDGTNMYECKLLTERGEQYAEDHGWDMYDSELHEKLWNDSHYTHLPHYAHKVWGCKKTAYSAA